MGPWGIQPWERAPGCRVRSAWASVRAIAESGWTNIQAAEEPTGIAPGLSTGLSIRGDLGPAPVLQLSSGFGQSLTFLGLSFSIYKIGLGHSLAVHWLGLAFYCPDMSSIPVRELRSCKLHSTAKK